MDTRARFAAALGIAALAFPARGFADNTLHVGTAQLDRATVVALGVQLLVTGDDNFDATVAMRYRVAGSTAWRDAMPLFRVHPESVTGLTVPAQFAGTVFDLSPGTTYDIELRATDPDGAVDQTVMLTGATRSVPIADPAHPRVVNVTDAPSLRTALGAAQPGDVINLANGVYAGEFAIHASGTATDPIVIRGASRDGAIIDGGNAGANALEVYGSHTHIERLTLQHDNRALRFQTSAAVDNVVRRVHIRDVVLGIGSRADQQDFYLCDNLMEGRLAWPSVYTDDGGLHANDDGIHVEGSGHVVCHNTLSGFGDAMKVEQSGARADDFYGNEVLSAYDNGLELDAMSGNGRCVRNRFTNTYATISFQPIYGGPVYALRNVLVNVAHEQLKLHSLGGTMFTSGIIVLHNTFVSPGHAMSLADSTAAHHYVVENNLWVGPAAPTGNTTVNWDTPIDYVTATIDSNGYWPDGAFHFGYGATGMTYPNFAAVVAGGRYEAHGELLNAPIFAGGLVAPADYRTTVTPADVTLASDSNAIDHGVVFANVGDGYQGSAPDLGALERGCPLPIYGVRPDGMDETNEPIGCVAGTPPGDGGVATDAGTDASDASTPRSDSAMGGDVQGDSPGPTTTPASCGCRAPASRGDAPFGLLAALGALAWAAVSFRRDVREPSGRRTTRARSSAPRSTAAVSPTDSADRRP